MHVLQMVPTLSVGGVERGVLDLSKGLLASGHRVSVVSAGGPLVDALTALGATHHRLPVHEKSPWRMASCVPAVTQIIRETGVDVVHARSRVPAWIGWLAARRARRPFVTTAHGFYSTGPGSRVMVWGRLVIAPSESLGQYLIERFGLPRWKLRVVPRGVDLSAFAYRPPPPRTASGPWRLGLFSRLSGIKGHDVALRACAHLRAKGHDVRLVIAGDAPGALRDHLQGVAKSLKLADRVEWLGIRQDMPELLASVDVALAPSTYPESFGRAVAEAQAVGRPVVASRLGALAELVREAQTGLLVPSGDPEALADGVERFIRDEALRNRCVEAGRRRVEQELTLDRMVERTAAVYDECLSQPRVLVWKLSALGDVVLATPSLRAIRRRYPKARVTLAVGRAAYHVAAGCPYVDDILIYDPKHKDRGLKRLAFIRRLRGEAFDWSIDLQNSRWTHLASWLAGIPVRKGYRRRLGWLLNAGVPAPRVVMTPVAHQHYLLSRCGVPPDGERLELWPSPLDEQAAERMLSPLLGGPETAPLVGLHPGGSGRWHTKRWPLERWAGLCDALAQQGAQVVVTGGPDEHEVGRALAGLAKSHPLIAIGQTSLMELACVIKRCDVFVSHDSSPLHVAAAVGTPTVALFGPTDPARHLPPGFQGQVMFRKVWCGPCYAAQCRTMTHACMRGIALEDVVAAVQRLLAARTAGKPGQAGA